MLGEFITRGLIMVLGYALPAIECFKTVEKNHVHIEELRFWCQYWIIVAILTVLERFGDTFVSWVPMYGEVKLALFLYLWYPKTKGTSYVYETFLRPCVVRHEPSLDRNLQEFRARAWNLAIYYWQNWTDLGQSTIFQVLDYLTGRSGTMIRTNKKEKNQLPPDLGLMPFLQADNNTKKKPSNHKQRSTWFSISSKNASRSVTQPTVPDLVQVQLQAHEERKNNLAGEIGSIFEYGTTEDNEPHVSRYKLRSKKSH